MSRRKAKAQKRSNTARRRRRKLTGLLRA